MTKDKDVEESEKDKPESFYEVEVGPCHLGEKKNLDEVKHNEGNEEVEEEEAEDEDEDEDEETEDEDENDELDGKRETKMMANGGANNGGHVDKDEDEDVETEESEEDDDHDKNVLPGYEDGVAPGYEDGVARAHDDGHVPEASLKKNMEMDEKHRVKDEKETLKPSIEDDIDSKLGVHESANHVDDEIIRKSQAEVVLSSVGASANVERVTKEEPESKEDTKGVSMDIENHDPGHSCIFDTDTSGGGESGTEDEQAAFMIELEKFHKENFLEFKPPKFYGEPLNLLKLWRAVMRLGGYDKVTTCKYWRQVGESFKPPKTCTTVSWTFRIFYEKALLEYEKYRSSGDGPIVPVSLPVPTGVENQASGSGRARRDAAARAMQGWHSQRILDNGEVSDPIIKDKNSASLGKREKQLKNLGMLKRKKPSSLDAPIKDVRSKVLKTQSETAVIDIGSPADWVKINVRETKDCYEVYALVPGLLREEVRVQSDPAGRLVISGEPENPDNPWCVTPFKKVVNLPTRIDPHQTSAVVTLHGQLFVRVPFEQYD